MLHITNYSEFKLYLPTSILSSLPEKLDHFYLFEPRRAKKLTSDLFYNNYETVRRG